MLFINSYKNILLLSRKFCLNMFARKTIQIITLKITFNHNALLDSKKTRGVANNIT